jgi:hypothetical protein
MIFLIMQDSFKSNLLFCTILSTIIYLHVHVIAEKATTYNSSAEFVIVMLRKLS